MPVWQQTKPLALRQGLFVAVQVNPCGQGPLSFGVPPQDLQSSHALVHDSKAA
jgi:hypothetical protein